MRGVFISVGMVVAGLLAGVAPVLAQGEAASDVPARTTNTIVIVAVVLSIIAIIVAMATRRKTQE